MVAFRIIIFEYCSFTKKIMSVEMISCVTLKVRFASYSGGKSNLENFAYLPTTIMNVNNGTPEYAQWNYRLVFLYLFINILDTEIPES